MSADLVAVLVVPAEGDSSGLLAPSRCSASNPAYPPACCTEWGVEGGDAWVVGMRPAADGKPIWALPLWWGGSLVEEGWDRLQRAVRREAQPLSTYSWHPRIERVLELAETARCIRIAERVVRLTRGADGRLVEVPDVG